MFGLGKPAPRIDRDVQLALRPTRLVEPVIEKTAAGGARLSVRLRPQGVQKWLLKIPETATKTFELDSVGLFVWTQCDGDTTIEALVGRVAKHLRVTEREADVATMAFLEMLTKRGLIGLRKPEEKK